jgi:hypothetical protein
MVPAKVLRELRGLYASEGRAIDLHKYSEPLFSVVFEMMTTDSFIAGIASKILDGELVGPEERAIASSPFLLEARWWKGENGQMFDVNEYPEVRAVALNIERLREKCNEILNFSSGG